VPHEIAPYMNAQMDQAALAMQKKLRAERGMTSGFRSLARGRPLRRPRTAKWICTGRFIGSWDLDYQGQFSERRTAMRAAPAMACRLGAGRRAVKDVWLCPAGELRHGDATAKINSSTTRCRVYDPTIDAAHSVDRSGGEEFLQMIGAAHTATTSCSQAPRSTANDALE